MASETNDRVQIYLPKVMLAQLAQIQEQTGISRSELIRNAIAAWLAARARGSQP